MFEKDIKMRLREFGLRISEEKSRIKVAHFKFTAYDIVPVVWGKERVKGMGTKDYNFINEKGGIYVR